MEDVFQSASESSIADESIDACNSYSNACLRCDLGCTPAENRNSSSCKMRIKYSKEQLLDLQQFSHMQEQLQKLEEVVESRNSVSCKMRVKYSKEQLLDLQFSHMQEQLQKWEEVLENMGSAANEIQNVLNTAEQGPKPRRRNKDKRQRDRGRNDSVSQKIEGLELIVDPESSMPLPMGETLYTELHSTFLENIQQKHQFDDEEKNQNYDEENNQIDCSLATEEYDYLDDSEEEYNILKPALSVEGEPDFDSGPPEDGLEYLRRVKWEAARCPKVKIAHIDPKKLLKKQTSYMPNIPSVPQCSESLLPSKEWEREFLTEFSNLRLAISTEQLVPDPHVRSLPSHKNESLWKNICFGSSSHERSNTSLECNGTNDNNGQVPDKSDTIFSEVDSAQAHSDSDVKECCVSQACESNSDNNMEGLEDEHDESAAMKETDNDCSNTKEGTICKVMREFRPEAKPLFSLVLSLDEISRASLFRYHVNWLEEESHLSKDKAVWLFALSAVLDKPLDAETCAAARALFRKCCCLRASNAVDDDELAMLNILITISGKYFGQAGEFM